MDTIKVPRVRFFNAGEFLNMLLAFRICWIDGRHGGGKTSFAVILAAWLLANKKVDLVVSNIPNNFRSEPTIPLNNACIILDEAWIYLDSRQSIFDYAAFVRKFNHFLLLPSVWEVHSKLSFFTCYRIFNGYAYGVPAWIYKWKLRRSSVKDNGWFMVINPEAVFGLYPDKFVPGDDSGIYEAVKETAKLAGYKGRRSTGFNEENKTEFKQANITSSSDLEDLFESSAFTQAQTIEDIEDSLKAFKRVHRKGS
jgi:hypothetical protein